MPQVERIVTLACVSNEVGGDLIGNASWQGVLLEPTCSNRPASHPGAEQVYATSLDGFDLRLPGRAWRSTAATR